MRHWLIVCITLIAIGCASVPSPEPIIAEVEVKHLDIPTPIELPVFPEIGVAVIDGVEYATILGSEFLIVEEYWEASEANVEIALNARLIASLTHDQLESALVAGVAQERRLIRRVDELNEERRDHFLTTWFYRLLLVGAAAVVLVAN